MRPGRAITRAEHLWSCSACYRIGSDGSACWSVLLEAILLADNAQIDNNMEIRQNNVHMRSQ